jgi:hypothetical protein
MTAAAGSLSEPQVLAHTKRRLFPDADDSDSYAVTDTQFALDEWLEGEPIGTEIRDTLAPFNHVRVGNGYPDLVGVRTLEPELLAVERFGEDPPLVAVEAKGRTREGDVDTQRGILQAYDRLHEANAAYLAAPAGVVSQTDRTLAREVNVGVLGVHASGEVEPLEVPRVVGNRTSEEATAIRFQASAQGVTDRNFSLNHPKNYLAYPLALYHDEQTAEVLAENVVRATDAARTGAVFLDLVTDGPDGPRLRPLGREVVRFALREYGSVGAALDAFEEWKRSRKRFAEIAPSWGQLTRRIVYTYPATQLFVEELQTMHDDGITAPSLVDLVRYLHANHPTFTVELFVRGTDHARERVLDGEGDLRTPALEDGDVYHSPTVFQLKTICFHAGILTENGTEPSNLTPSEDEWALREPLDRFRV